MGETVELATLNFQILEAKELTSLTSNNQFIEPITAASGTKFIVLKYTVENTTKAPYFLSSSDLFSLIDTERRQYTESNKSWRGLAGLESYLWYENLNPNIPFTGYTVFEVPLNSSNQIVAACKRDTNVCYTVDLFN